MSVDLSCIVKSTVKKLVKNTKWRISKAKWGSTLSSKPIQWVYHIDRFERVIIKIYFYYKANKYCLQNICRINTYVPKFF